MAAASHDRAHSISRFFQPKEVSDKDKSAGEKRVWSLLGQINDEKRSHQRAKFTLNAAHEAVIDLTAIESPSHNPDNEQAHHKEVENHDETPVGDEETRELPSSPLSRSNPFAQFAHSEEPQKNAFERFAPPNASTASSAAKPKMLSQPTISARKESILSASKPRLDANTKRKPCNKCMMRELPRDEQDRITQKWISLADPPTTSSLEARRFQVLVAAQLHARCQEPSVKKALTALRSFFPNGMLTVDHVAGANPDDLAKCLTNLQYYNVKAQHLVRAAKEIQLQFGGVVPEDEHALNRITGVGKVFADLLAFVNRREVHEGGGGDKLNNVD